MENSKIKLSILTILVIIINISCNMKKSMIDSIIVIRSPGQCVQEIIISPDGNLKYTVGGVTSYTYKDDFNKFDYIKEKYSTTLNSIDLEYINDKLKVLEKSNIKGSIKKDAFRFELFVDNQKRVDIFGSAPEDFLLILKKIKTSFPNVDYACW